MAVADGGEHWMWQNVAQNSDAQLGDIAFLDANLGVVSGQSGRLS